MLEFVLRVFLFGGTNIETTPLMSSAAADYQSFRVLRRCLWLSVGSLSGTCSSSLVSSWL